MIVSFTVPGHPTPKERARVVRSKRGKVHSFTPPKTANYEATVKLVAASARPSKWPMRARYTLDVDARRLHARGDLDNILKAVSDACNGVLWADDSRIYAISARMSDGDDRPRVVVNVSVSPVRCSLVCAAETYFPDEAGRCEACAALSALKRTTPAKRAPRARRAA